MNNTTLYHNLVNISNVAENQQKAQLIELLDISDSYHSITSLYNNFFRHNTPTIQAIIIDFIRLALQNITSKNQYYSALRYLNISKTDLDVHNSLSTEQYLTLVFMASCNRDGHVRKKAVSLLIESNDKRAIKFILFRLSDWAFNVRNSANVTLQHYLQPDYVVEFIKQLPEIYALKNTKRVVLTAHIQAIRSFIIAHHARWLPVFQSFSDKERSLLSPLLHETDITKQEKINIFLRDKHFMLKKQTLVYFDELTDTQIAQLVTDTSTKVRLSTLYKLEGSAFFEKIIPNYLYDTSASVRHFAHFYLKNNSPHNEHDFIEIYVQNLKKSQHIIGSLGAIAEANAKEHAPLVASYLTHHKRKIQRVAFLALQELDFEQAYAFALDHLDTDILSLRKVIYAFFVQHAKDDALCKMREILETSNFEQKKLVLCTLSNIGGYRVIAELMLASVDDNEVIRNLALEFLHQWRLNMANNYGRPQADVLARARQACEKAKNIHDEKQYFLDNPVESLVFYLKC